jgi:hypothetical protein
MAQLLKRPIEMIRRPEEDEVGKGVLPWSKLYGFFFQNRGPPKSIIQSSWMTMN